MKKITITFVIVTIAATLTNCLLHFCFFDYARWGQTFATITFVLNTIPDILLAVLLFLHYRKEGTLQEKLHQRYMCYLLLFVVLVPALGPVLRRPDLFSNISTILTNIAITCVACDFCKYRQSEKMKWSRFVLCCILVLSIIGILFVPMPANIVIAYFAKIIILYAFVSFIVDACQRKYPHRGWAIVAALFAPALFIPAYLLETNPSNSSNPS